MKKLLSMLLSALMIVSVMPVLASTVTVSSTFNGLTGVPVCTDIPFTFSESVTLSASDITVLPKTSFTLEGSDASYTVNFTGNMKAGNNYTIKVADYGTITYQTAYSTDLASIATNTPAGDGRTAAFGENISEFTMKIDFMSYPELPLNKWIKLYDDSTENIGILVSNDGGHIILGLHRWDVATNTWRGPAVTASQLNVDFSDVAYLTVKDNNARIFVVSKDGTVTCGNNWNFSASSIANCKFDAVSIDSILFGVEVGNTVETPDADEYIEAACTATSAINGLVGVPTDAKIPVTLSEEVALNDTNVKITANGEVVNGKIVEGSGTEYTVDFDMDYNTAYSIQIGTGSPITFTTAYNTDLVSIATNTPAGPGRTAEFAYDLKNLTLKIDFISSYGLPDGKFIELFSDNTYVSAIRITKMNNKIAVDAFRYTKGSTNVNTKIGPASLISEIEYTDTLYITYKDNAVYPFVVSSDGSVRTGSKWNYSDKDIAGSAFDKVEINSTVFGVAVGGEAVSVPSAIEITSADSSGAVSASYTLNSSDATLVCAVYDESSLVSTLLDAKVQTLNSANGTTTFTLNTNSKTNLKYKLFAFNDLESITPLVVADEYPLN